MKRWKNNCFTHYKVYKKGLIIDYTKDHNHLIYSLLTGILLPTNWFAAVFKSLSLSDDGTMK